MDARTPAGPTGAPAPHPTRAYWRDAWVGFAWLAFAILVASAATVLAASLSGSAHGGPPPPDGLGSSDPDSIQFSWQWAGPGDPGGFNLRRYCGPQATLPGQRIQFTAVTGGNLHAEPVGGLSLPELDCRSQSIQMQTVHVTYSWTGPDSDDDTLVVTMRPGAAEGFLTPRPHVAGGELQGPAAPPLLSVPGLAGLAGSFGRWSRLRPGSKAWLAPA